MSTNSSTAQSAPVTSAGTWGLRYSGLVMGPGGKNYVKEFTGMWRLKPDADLDALTKTLAPGGWLNPAGGTFSVQTTKLGLIRTARWFVARTQDFDGYTLFFISQFDGTLEKYFDDFTLNGAENLFAVWGNCVGCPSGPNVSARDIVFEPGCGDARITIAAVRSGAPRGICIDIDAERVADSRTKVKDAGLADRIDIRQGDALDVKDLSQATVVFLYMGDHFNMLIRPNLWRDLPVGARIVSHRFTMGDWKPDKTVSVDGADGLG